MARNKSPINRSIMIGCVGLILVLSLLLSVQTKYAFTQALFDQYNARLLDVVTFVEHSTDTDDLRECIRSKTSSPKRDELQRLINVMVDDYEMEFIYIVLPMDTEEGTLLSIVSSTSAAERAAGDTEDWPILYDCSDQYTREEIGRYLDALHADGVSYFEESSDWGDCYTCCVPLRASDGEVIALACADYMIETLQSTIMGYTARFATVIVIVCGLFGILLGLWLRKNVTRPLQALERNTLRFASMAHNGMSAEEFSFAAEELGSGSEVKSLIDAMAKLSKEVKDQAESAEDVKNYAREMERENQRLAEEAGAARKIAELTESVTSLLNNMPGLTFSKDTKTGQYLACNRMFAEFAHREKPEDVIGLTDAEIFDAETAAHFVEDDRKSMEMDEPNIIYENVFDASGNPRQFQTTKLKFTDASGRLCLLGMSVDFTELMHIKRETNEVKEAYEKAQSASNMYLHIAHALSANYTQLYYVDLESGMYIEYGSDPEHDNVPTEREGQSFFRTFRNEFGAQIHESDRDSFLETFSRSNVLRSLAEHESLEMTCRLQKQGESAYASIKAMRVQDDDSHLMIGVNTDEKIDVRNELTGLYMSASFSVYGKELLQEVPDDWCVIAIDLEHFKLFNEWYGREAGDQLLARIGARLSNVEQVTGGLACYMGQDDFCLIAPYEEDSVRDLYADIHNMIKEYGTSVGFMPAFGICMTDTENTIDELLDRAALASHHAKENYHTRIRVFEESMYQKTERDYQILSDFQKALKEHELFIMLQPQCEADTGKIVGAESLVRWKKRDEQKLVSPGIFVPVLEQYGFVTELDKFVWEEVCAWQRKWIDGGNTALPVSVNVSQIDIFSIDVPEYFDALIRKYDLPVDVVKIEITESAYVGDGAVADTVTRLRERGFLVLMDDFGSGYSSLNMLRSINVDIIKLDAQFLRMSSDDRKGVHILESIVNMAKTMGVPIIVEGVETQEEMDFISELGCQYVQGYFFFRPMPVPDFEALISLPENIDTKGFVFETREELHTREFLDRNVFSDAMLNNILGPVAFFQLSGENAVCIRYNQKFYNELGSNRFEQWRSSIQKLIVEEDLPVFYSLLEQAVDEPLNGAMNVIRFQREDGRISQFRVQIFYLDEDESGKRFYGSIRDITQIGRISGQIQLLSSLSSSEVVFLSAQSDGSYAFRVAVHGLEDVFAVSRDALEHEFNSGEFQARLSEDNRQEMEGMLRAGANLQQYSPVFPVRAADGRNIPLRFRFESVRDQGSGVDYLMILKRGDD